LHYYIDGYNFLFRITKSYEAMRARQKELLAALNDWTVQFKLNVTIVFDGRQKDPPEAVRGHLANLEVIYTPEHQTADDYILQEIEFSSTPSEETVVSSDRELTGKAKQRGARVQSIEDFFSFLGGKQRKKKSPSSKTTFQDTPANIERLLKIFEQKDQGRDNGSEV